MNVRLHNFEQASDIRVDVTRDGFQDLYCTAPVQVRGLWQRVRGMDHFVFVGFFGDHNLAVRYAEGREGGPMLSADDYSIVTYRLATTFDRRGRSAPTSTSFAPTFGKG